MVPGVVNPAVPEPLHELALVGIENDLWIRLCRISPPLEDQLEVIPHPAFEDQVANGSRLELRAVSVAQEQQSQVKLPGLDGNDERCLYSLPRHRVTVPCLERPALGDPAFDRVDTPLLAQLDQFVDLARIL